MSLNARETFKVGDKVTNRFFGAGTVVGLPGADTADYMVLVKFEGCEKSAVSPQTGWIAMNHVDKVEE